VLDDAKVVAVTPVPPAGEDAPTSFDVRFETVEGPVRFAAETWDPGIRTGDAVDARVRGSWFSESFTGEQATVVVPSPTSAPAEGSDRVDPPPPPR
jgi:hypothetical protein